MLFLFAIILLAYALLIGYYWSGWQKLREESIDAMTGYRFLSVVVAARNEEKNITALLTAIAGQTYPAEFFEVIVVDDYSSDGTRAAVQGFSFQNLSLIRPGVAAAGSSKKRAIEAGIQKARGELIVATDADCIPHPEWLQAINSLYTRRNAAFIAAPVKFFHDESLLQIFQSLDFMVLQGITAASVSLNFHTMCNGANLAYEKNAFQEVNGFEGIDRIATGDDMLLMYKIWKQHPSRVHYLKSKGAIVSTQPAFSWKDFFMQRKRWASKTMAYDDLRITAVLFFVYLFNCAFVALVVLSLFNTIYWWYVAGFWIGKTFIEFPFVYSVARFYGEQKLMRYFFFFQPLHMLYTVFVGLWSQFGRYEWKGRKTK